MDDTRCSKRLSPSYGYFEQAVAACGHSEDCRAVEDRWCNNYSFNLCPASSTNIPSDGHCVYGKGNHL